MRTWLRRVRGAMLMGLTWGITWFGVGMLIELVHNIWPNPLGRMVDIWPAALGLPAFVGGVGFAKLLAFLGRRKKFGELSVPWFAVLGAFSGAMVSLVPAALVAVGLADFNGGTPMVWRFTLGLMGPLAFVGATSAAGTLALARRGKQGSIASVDERPPMPESASR